MALLLYLQLNVLHLSLPHPARFLCHILAPPRPRPLQHPLPSRSRNVNKSFSFVSKYWINVPYSFLVERYDPERAINDSYEEYVREERDGKYLFFLGPTFG